MYIGDMKPVRIILIATLALVLAGLGLWAYKGLYPEAEHHGAKHAHHRDVLKYRGAKAVLTLDRILVLAAKRITGEIIKTEFDVEDGVPLYEIKFIRKDGQVVELYVDARSGETLKEEED